MQQRTFSRAALLACSALALTALPSAALAQASIQAPPSVPAEAPPPRALPQPIEAAELQQLDAWSVGLLSRAQGGLDPNLWGQTDPAALAAILDRLPTVYESPAAQTIARRVLLSGGAAPRGDASLAARKRFEALGKMGAADDLAMLAAGAGPGLNDPLIAQYAAQAELARNQRPQACARGRAAETDQPNLFLLRLRAYCAAAGGDRAAADLALELARGAGPEDAWYTGATAAAGGAPGARPPAARWDNSLTVQLSHAGSLRPGPNPMANASTLALVTLARAEATPQPNRAQAAALAFRRGALPVAEARTILASTPPDTAGAPAIAVALRQVEAAFAAPAPAPADPAAPPSLTPPPNPHMQAATAIAAVLRQATAPADFAAAARFFKDDIARLTTAPDMAAALLFARAALATGDATLAARLIDSAVQAGVDAGALAPLQAALATARGPQAGAAAVARRIDAAGASGASGAAGAARDVAILAALGFPLDGQAQAFLIANPPQGGARADAGAMAALSAAIERRAAGDAGLLAALAASPGTNTLDANSLTQLIVALRGIGLEDEARRLAVEALLAGQPAS